MHSLETESESEMYLQCSYPSYWTQKCVLSFLKLRPLNLIFFHISFKGMPEVMKMQILWYFDILNMVLK